MKNKIVKRPKKESETVVSLQTKNRKLELQVDKFEKKILALENKTLKFENKILRQEQMILKLQAEKINLKEPGGPVSIQLVVPHDKPPEE